MRRNSGHGPDRYFGFINCERMRGGRRERGPGRERGGEGVERERERRDKTRQDYFIVRPPAHYNRSEHSGNSNSHGSNDGLKLSFLVFKMHTLKRERDAEQRRIFLFLEPFNCVTAWF